MLLENFEVIEVDGVFVIVAHLICPTYLEAKEFKEIINLRIGLGRLCEHIDSTFIGAVIKSFKEVTAFGGDLRIVKPVNSGVDIFLLSNTLSVFNLYNTREDAIKSFENDSQSES
jgi:anti-anti-sigma regulatory factor